MVTFHRKISQLESTKKFTNSTDHLNNLTVGDFWKWAYSDLLQNTTRAVLAEYLVAALLGVDKIVRNPWLSYDLKLSNGITIEVKSMSRLQAWSQNKLSTPKVVISKKRNWNPETNTMEEVPTLNADIFVICYFTAEEHSKVDLLDLDQWVFFVLDKAEVCKIIEKTKTISLILLDKMHKEQLKSHELVDEIRRLSKN